MSELPKPPESQPPIPSDDWEDEKPSYSNRPIAIWIVGAIVVGLIMGIVIGSYWGAEIQQQIAELLERIYNYKVAAPR